MTDATSLPLLDHELAEDELHWISDVYKDFDAARVRAAEHGDTFNPKEALREVLGRPQHRLPTPMELTGDGPWRNARNSHGRLVACVFLNKVELHRHAKSRTDQFPMYVVGEADAFSVGSNAVGELKPVTPGAQFHNPPGAPHAFVPKVGEPVGADWEIAFVAITPRNLKDDTQAVSEDTRTAFRAAVGYQAPVGV